MSSVPHAPPLLFDLMLEESRAAFNERLHQRTCIARLNRRPCRACLEHESDWLAASIAVSRCLAEADEAEAWRVQP